MILLYDLLGNFKFVKMNLNLQELSKEEMVSVTGGSWIGRVWDRIKKIFTGSDNGAPREGEVHVTVLTIEL